ADLNERLWPIRPKASPRPGSDDDGGSGAHGGDRAAQPARDAGGAGPPPRADPWAKILLSSSLIFSSGGARAMESSLTSRLRAVSSILRSPKDSSLSPFSTNRSRSTLAISSTDPVLIFSVYSR